jgi:hypothetical protein
VIILAQGVSRELDRWTLCCEDSDRESLIYVDVVTVLDEHARGGYSGVPLRSGANLAVYQGLNDAGPYRMIIAVSDQVDSVRVQMSDTTTETLDLHGVAHFTGVRFGVLIYPRSKHANRIELFDRNGLELETKM